MTTIFSKGAATRSPRQSAAAVRRWFGALVMVAVAVVLVLAGCDDAAAPTPPAVTSLRITALAASSGGVIVTVAWQNPVSAANIELSWTPATPTPRTKTVTAIADSAQSTTVTLVDDTTYTISAVAIDGSNKRSSAARITNQRVDLAVPAAPTGVILTPLGNSAIAVSWTASTSSDVAGYEVLWATAAAALPASPLGRQAVAASASSATTGVLTAGTTYFVAVFARDGANALGAVRTSSLSATANAVAPIAIDSDGDTLIDISTLDMLNNIRCNLAGTTYRTVDSGGVCATSGALQCGSNGITDCTGYELMRTLNFATAGDYASGTINTAWRPTDAADTVVADTTTATSTGWEPIGTHTAPFLSTFDGNNNSITNLYARRGGRIGLFGQIGSGSASAIVRDLALIDGHVYGDGVANFIGMAVGDMQSGSSSISDVSVRNGSVNGEGGNDNAGGIVGNMSHGTVSNSYSTATVNGGAGIDSIGGLIGRTDSITINGSYASGAVNGGAGGDRVGGLVGSLSAAISRIIASHATGAVDGGTGSDDVGGLVGESSGSIIASYATGAVTVTVSDTAGGDRVGGLVGDNNSTITASYASGNASGGAGNEDRVGGLVGDNAGPIIASYASGNASGGAGNIDNVGGLVGDNHSTLTASYATGAASGGAGGNDVTGALSGNGALSSSNFTVSYGFGSWFTVSSEPVELHVTVVNPSLPSGITAGTGIAGAQKLTAGTTPATTAAGAQWNAAASNTMGAWNFGTATQAPAIVYADYDGAGTAYNCNLFPAKIPGTETPIVCGTTLLPSQPR